MTENIIIAGSGGQGVLTLGIFLANIGIYENKKVTWLPAYGAEKRGGFSFCNLVISDGEIFSPVVEVPDTLVLFDQRAVDTYGSKSSKDTFVLGNTSLIQNDTLETFKEKIMIPADDIARKVGFIKAMNTVMAGAYLGAKRLFNAGSGEAVIAEILKGKKKDVLDKNIQAFKEGLNFAAGKTEGK